MIPDYLLDLTVGQPIFIKSPRDLANGRRFYRTAITRLDNLSLWTTEGVCFNRRTGLRRDDNAYFPEQIATQSEKGVLHLMTEEKYAAMEAFTCEWQEKCEFDKAIRELPLISLNSTDLVEIYELILSKLRVESHHDR